MSSIISEHLKKPIHWDLSALFSGVDDPKIEKVWNEINYRADAFASTYRSKINTRQLTAKTLYEAILEFEAIHNELAKPLNYASLLFSTNTADPKLGAFLQAQKERATEINVKLVFFELDLQALPEDIIQNLLANPILNNYRHYIQLVRIFSPHRLSEPEEIVLEETANTGRRAWVRFFEEVTSNKTYPYRPPGSDKTEELTQEQVLTLLRSPDRSVRPAAADAFTEGLQELQKTIIFIYNTLLQDKSVLDRLRRHPYPEHARHLSNELDKETVDLVITLCKEHFALVERYYEVKRQILGLNALTHIDRYAPLFDTEENIDFDQARKIVLGSIRKFSKIMEERAAEFFNNNWIDAEPALGKRGGAYCSYNTPDTHPVVFMNFLNKLSDVKTLAHEIGHGIHASLSRVQTYFNFSGTLPLAELASTFCEMLVFESLVSNASKRDQLALYAQKIEDTFATVFRQAALFSFEQKCHELRRSSGELPPEAFCQMWQEELQSMFGKSLTLGDQHQYWWAYISHFFSSPFYVYAYAFGELLALSLYQKAKKEGPTFADKYVQVLRLGGSRSPQELMVLLDVDLKSRDFWLNGFEMIESLVRKFETLWAEVSETTQKQ
jgi:oligoendopeptidase F